MIVLWIILIPRRQMFHKSRYFPCLDLHSPGRISTSINEVISASFVTLYSFFGKIDCTLSLYIFVCLTTPSIMLSDTSSLENAIGVLHDLEPPLVHGKWITMFEKRRRIKYLPFYCTISWFYLSWSNLESRTVFQHKYLVPIFTQIFVLIPSCD